MRAGARIAEDRVSQRKTIVVADDDDLLQEILRHKLASRNFDVHGATDGDAAMELVRSLHPDIALLDLMMPGRDGLDILRDVKADPELASIPILILSARNLESEIVAALELGAADYVVKPISLAELLARIMRIVGTQPR